VKNYADLQAHIKGQPRTWLVTGAAGFIGSHLVEKLLSLDQKVIGLDNFSTGKRANLSRHQNFRFIEGDIRRLETCREACKDAELVLHQAALGSVPRSIDDPIATTENNVGGFLNMLVAARDAGIARFVYASSSAVYGDHPTLPRVEDTIGAAVSPYGLSKFVDELYATVFARCYGFGAIGLRYFNVFGARQDPRGAYAAVIPRWVAAMLAGDAIEINGDGETTRDFCHVANVVQANLLAAVAAPPEACHQVFNVAVGGRTSLNELARSMRDLLQERNPGLRVPPFVYRDFRAGDVLHSQADISKARAILGYDPVYDVRAGLAEAMPWYESRGRLDAPALVQGAA